MCVTLSERVWDYAVIPYEIDSNFSGNHKSLFKQVCDMKTSRQNLHSSTK